jgi:uncharacterized protein YpmB
MFGKLIRNIIILILLVVIVYLLFFNDSSQPKEICQMEGIEGIHFGGDAFCHSKGYEYCKEAYLLLEVDQRENFVWMPINCSTPHSDELWENTVEEVGEDRVLDGLYQFSCCNME